MDVIQQTEKNVRGLRHDLKHHVWKLWALAEEERYLDILGYLNVMETFVENSKEYVISGNKEIDAILKDIIGTVEETGQIMELNNQILQESNDRLNGTVKIFEIILQSSNNVISNTNILKKELVSIIGIKEKLMESMQNLEDISEKSVETSTEISTSTEEQVAGVENILCAMEKVQEGIEGLAGILQEN